MQPLKVLQYSLIAMKPQTTTNLSNINEQLTHNIQKSLAKHDFTRELDIFNYQRNFVKLLKMNVRKYIIKEAILIDKC